MTGRSQHDYNWFTELIAGNVRGWSTMATSQKKRRIFWMIAALLTLLLGPYLYSRVLSSWRVVKTYDVPKLAEVPPSQEPLASLRIGTYNIAHGRGPILDNWAGGDAEERANRLTEISELIKAERLDVLVLNEVDFNSTWSYHVNQAAEIARQAGFRYRVEQRNLDFRLPYGSWQFGNAVLSKHPIVAAEVIDLPGYATWETVAAGKKRGALCTIEIPGGRRIRVAGVHLSHRSEALRVDGIELLRQIRDASDVPMIVAGDLNSTPPGFLRSRTDEAGRNAIATMLKGDLWHTRPTAPPAEEGLTYSSTEPKNVIDWIVIPRQWRFAEYRAIASELSDHRPVVGEVLFDGGL
jgi:endonuclease/exonuclease/phosphatase family metal-dependent hydrolase